MILDSITATNMSDLLRLYRPLNSTRSNGLHQDLNYTIRYFQNVIKCISIKLYNPEKKQIFKCRHIIFPYENSNNLRLVFSRCAPAQRHLTWELKQNTCEPCNASTTTVDIGLQSRK